MTVAFDHVVVMVPELASAVREFADAGFVVTSGGRHDAIPTENALIVFEDGGYVELLAPRDEDARESIRQRSQRPGWAAELRRASAIARRFLPHLAGPPGVADFALSVRNLARLAAEMRRRGFPATGPVAMSRERADGVRLDWQLVLPASARLPFFIEDRTPRSLRVPGEPAVHAHPNGAKGVREVRVRVRQVAPSALEYADLFGARPHADPDGSAHLDLGAVRVVLEGGEPEGARGVSLRDVSSLGGAAEGLGVRGVQEGP